VKARKKETTRKTKNMWVVGIKIGWVGIEWTGLVCLAAGTSGELV
jgi:hypothetical protein